MADRPILFSTPMVEAIVGGRKTQTRRILKPQPKMLPGVNPSFSQLHARRDCGQWQLHGSEPASEPFKVRFEVGDLLWVREAWARTSVAPIVESIDNPFTVYRAADNRTDYGGPWKPGIHLKRMHSRITLQVTAVRVDRLWRMTDKDAIAEGCRGVFGRNPDFPDEYDPSPREEFEQLWKRINGADAWDANPWVVALTFKAFLANIDSPWGRAA
jgi:hypothetical protein